MSPRRLAAYIFLVLALSVDLYVLGRAAPFAKGLAKESAGLRRVLDYLWQPVNRTYSRAYYTEAGQRYVPWIRATSALTTIALVIAALV